MPCRKPCPPQGQGANLVAVAAALSVWIGQGKTADELAILAATSEDTLTTDEIVDKTQIPAKRVLSALTILQIGGKIEEHPGRRFCSLVKLE